MSIFVIGDIHGCYNKLIRLMSKIEKEIQENKDEIIFLGDYVDRGDNSYSVINLLIELPKKFPKNEITFLLGNHEDMMLTALVAPCLDLHSHQQDMFHWLRNGGTKTIESYGGKASNIPEEHFEFLRELHLLKATSGFLFSHAGCASNKTLEEHGQDDFLWNRDCVIKDAFIPVEKKFTIVFGHTPQKEVLFLEKRICIDTGACFKNGKLTCLKLPEKEIFQT
jgi:serine/threonine protein phosphatase 1